jgi:sulfide dehydrogenase cytochrome subunit
VILLQTLATTDVLMFSQLRHVQSNLQGVPMKHQLQRSTRALAVTAFVLGASLTALAQTPPAGRLLASNCFQCHGTNGKGPGFDSLNGKSSSEIYKDLIEFRSGKEGAGLMAKHSLGYTDAQLRQLSQWLSTQR